MIRLSLLGLTFLATTFSVALFMTGGFATTLYDVRVSARSPLPAGVLAVSALAAWLVLALRAGAVTSDLAKVDAWLERRGGVIVCVTAALACAVTVFFNSFSAAGSDASGYLSHAVMLFRGELTREEPLAAIADWPDGQMTLAPLGWQARLEGGGQVPTYAIGLPLLMAAPHAIGGAIAASLVVPLAFFTAIVVAGLLARSLGGVTAGTIAAVWFATSPVALIESMQIMSDVPVTAAWLACWYWVMTGRSPLGAGMLAAVAVLIRPNLAPLAIVPLLSLARGRLRRDAAEGDRVYGFSRAAWFPPILLFAGPVVVAGLVVAGLQWRYFGSPFRSGYGTAAEIYALANVIPNVGLYGRWLLDSHGPWLLVAPLALLWPRSARAPMRWLLAFATLLTVSYLLYAIFETWSYLRFLLPALAIAMIAAAVVAGAVLEKMPAAGRVPVVVIVVLALAAANVAAARRLGAFRFAAQQNRAALAGRYLDSALPLHAVVVSGEQSGAVRYYTGRPILRWDFLESTALDAAVSRLVRERRDVWIALDVWEEELFRAKFRDSAHGGLDWPPVMDSGTEMRTRAWRIRDREAFLRGAPAVTDRLR